MDITIIWDSVNTASRIENLTNNENKWILFSENTFNLIKNKNNFKIEKVWEKQLKWKKEKVFLYSMN
jgi:class 3 adenylate cyclase